jgi:hypothetical protein
LGFFLPGALVLVRVPGLPVVILGWSGASDRE